MGRFIQGAAFYLFVYFMLGLINSGILYFLTKFFHVYPAISLGLLIFLTVFVLFFGFKKSIEIFFQFKLKMSRTVLGWIVQVVLFITVATLIEKKLAAAVGNPKVFKVLTVFINFVVFFITYWLSVRFIVLRGECEVR